MTRFLLRICTLILIGFLFVGAKITPDEPTCLFVNEHTLDDNSASTTDCMCDPVSDRVALMALYNATNGDNWTNNTNWGTTASLDTWYGVETNADGCVTCLDLDGNDNCEETNIGNNLVGPIPIEISNLSQIEILSLNNNSLTGQIPLELSYLNKLEGLYLSYNELTGTIPVEIGNLVNLASLDLAVNELTGTIPEEFGNLVNLTSLDLAVNELTGTIPVEIGNLVNLASLDLSRNELTGTIPVEIGNLVNLTLLYLQVNQLTGTIPVEIGNLVNLTLLYLQVNQLTGTIPVEIGNLINLTNLDFISNELTGTIPVEIGNLVNLTHLRFWSNNLTGTIPEEFGSLVNLTNLSLAFNELTGIIPVELGNLVNLTNLLLFSNEFTGTIPEELGNLVNLTRLNLANNQLEGCFKEELNLFCDLNFSVNVNMNGYDFTNNPLLPWQGDFERFCNEEDQIGATCDDGDANTIDDKIQADCTCRGINTCRQTDSLALVALYNSTDGPNWTNTWDLNSAMDTWYGVTLNGDGCVECLDLDGNANCHGASNNGNNLVGNIPVELGDLIYISNLYLSDNQLSNLIPSELGDLSNLKTLNLDYNQLDGAIPPELGDLSNLKTLCLRSNGLTGTIPIELGNLDSLTWLDLAYNEFTGSIPIEVGNLDDLITLDLRGNQLTGNIPIELSNLSNLQRLTLAENQLIGNIPIELGNLNNLTSLNLQINELTGNIPVELSNLSNLSFLVLSGNQLTGNIPVGLGNLTSLGQLILGSNQLSGSIPVELGNLSNLFELKLDRNALTGEIPMELGELTNLVELYLYNNNITGRIPSTLGNLSQLTEFYLQNNQLEDCFPTELLTHCDIIYDLTNNPLLPWQGDFERFCNGEEQIGASCDDGDATTIDDKIQDDCTCRGINNCTQTDSLTLANFYLATDGPNWNNNSNWLVPGQAINTWNGVITNAEGCVTGLTLANNNLSGDLPNILGDLASLEILSLANNNLTGTLPIGMGNLTNLTSLTIGQNEFEGTIPQAILELPNLNLFNIDFCNIDGLATFNNPDLTLWVNDNLLTFEDVLPAVGTQISPFTYYPQDSIFAPTTYTVNEGQALSIDLGIDVNITTNQYQWYKDNISFVLETDNTLDFAAIQTTDAGTYRVEVTNPNAPNLTLYSYDIVVEVTASCRMNDSLALVALYNSTDGANWTNTWDLNSSMDTWYGVNLNGDGCVTCIDMGGDFDCSSTFLNLGNLGNNLSGSIPSEIGELVMLATLDLSDNNLIGNIPPEIGNLTKVTHLDLSYNSLNGEIPPEIGQLTELNALYLLYNQLTGSIPNEIGNLTELRNINLFRNQLSGELPVVLGDIDSLRSLILHSNQFNGVIPKELGNLSQLVSLYLGNNDLVGSIPVGLGNLTSLGQLILGGNQLSGSIPVELGNLSNLFELKLDRNALTGEMPMELGELTNLVELYLYNNNITGRIPSTLGNLSQLTEFYLQNNQLEDCFPNELLNHCGLEFSSDSFQPGYNLTNNPLLPWQGDFERFCNGEEQIGAPCDDGDTSTVDDKIQGDCICRGVEITTTCRYQDSLALMALYYATDGANWTNKWDTLQPMDTWYGVTLSGEGCVTSLDMDGDTTNHIYAADSGNNLIGSIPTTLSDLQNLTFLSLGFNMINGEIPSELGDLHSLRVLLLHSNQIEGEIPSELGDLENLGALWLDNNKLEGSIPFNLGNLNNLGLLYLDGNQLSGNIPKELGNLQNLAWLDLGDNQLEGSIPSQLGDLQNITSIYLNRNNLTGEIPQELADLSGLTRLRLNDNNLNGSILDLSSCENLLMFYYHNNNFVFQDILPTFSINDLLVNGNEHSNPSVLWDTLRYAPQDSIFTDTTITLLETEHLDVDLLIDEDIDDNVYTWYKDGQLHSTITGNNNLTIDALILADTGVYTCEVTNAGAPQLTLYSRNITVVVEPNCGIFLANAGDNTIIDCNNSSIILQASTSVGENLDYQWLSSGGENLGTQPTLTTSTPDTYTVLITNEDNGCTSTASTEVTSDITQPDINTTSDGQLNCTNNTVQLSANSTTPNIQYTWSGPNTFSTNDQNPSVTESGIYTLIVTSENGCTSTEQITVESDFETPVININMLSPTSSITCENSSVILVANAVQDINQLNVEWLDEMGTSFSSENQVELLNAGIYTLQVTNPTNGCLATSQVTVDENTAIPTINILAPTALTCTQTSTVLDATASDMGANFSTEWTDSNGNAVASNTLSPSISTAGIYTLTIVNTSNGCSQTTSTEVTSDTTQPDISTTNDGQLNCTNNTVQLSANSTTPNIQYTWTGPNTFSTNDQNPSVTEAGMYTLIITSENGCTSTEQITVESDFETPDISINMLSPTSSITCENSSVILAANTVQDINQLNIQWLDATGASFSTANQVELLNAGMYTLQVTNPTNGCLAISQFTVDENTAIPNVDIVAPTTLTCTQTSIVLDATASDMGTGFSVEWTDSNGNAVASNTLSPSINTAGIYTLTITNISNGCSENQSVTVADNSDAPTVSINETAAIVCTNTSIELTGFASGGNDMTYTWSSPDGTILGGSNTLNPEIGSAGLYKLSVTNNENGCTQTASMQISNFQASIDSEDYLVCDALESPFLMGNLPIQIEGISGIWQSLGTADLTANGNEASISNLAVGENTFVWSLSTPDCPEFMSESIHITLDIGAPIAMNDVIEANQGEEELILNVLENDSLSNSAWQLNILDLPQHGNLTYNELTGDINFEPDADYIGEAVLVYELCNPNCANCTQAEVLFSLKASSNGPEISSIITPNSDGLNDFLHIDGVDDYPENEVFVYNRWGSLVWKGKNYDNLKTVFQGENLNRNELPEGTYYFTANLSFGEGEIRYGSVTIKRD